MPIPGKLPVPRKGPPLHGAGGRRRLHFRKCALQAGTRTLTDIGGSR
jgi:hypothetical protein